MSKHTIHAYHPGNTFKALPRYALLPFCSLADSLKPLFLALCCSTLLLACDRDKIAHTESVDQSASQPTVEAKINENAKTEGIQKASDPDTPAPDEEKDADGWTIFSDAEARSYLANCKASFAKTTSLFRSIEQHAKPYSTKALLKDLGYLEILLNKTMGKASLFRNVHPNESLRKAADQCQQRFVELITDITLSRPLYDHASEIDIAKLDNPIDQRYVKELLRDFRRSGVNLDKEKQDKIRKLNEEINLLGQDFNRNIRQDVRTVEITDIQTLKGLPDDYITAHKADKDGKIIITTDYPDYYPFMQYAENDAVRLELYKQFRSRGYPQNSDILKSLLEKRYELAKLLGYKNYAEYVTEILMIKTPENADNFINKISDLVAPRAKKEYATLLTRLQKIDPSASKVGDWQKLFLEGLVKKEQYQVDSQEIRQYFRYDNVKQGIFELVETLFSVDITPWDTEVWHPSVNAYEMWDIAAKDEKRLIGRFFLDMHPREGKYKHAAAFGFQGGVRGEQLPMTALVCNFPGGDDSEGFMEHGQVETFLHEFGHLIHGLFGGNQRWVSHSGTKTERDFVEAPSQMLEEWVWDYETLKTFATNSKGEVIPKSLVEKMNAARNYGRGVFTTQQMFYAALSLNYYNRDPSTFDLLELSKTLQDKYASYAYVDDTHFYASFGHLFGYSAVYYSYMWSLVIASDMFSEFKKHGIRNPAIAKRYRDKVLSVGGSKDANEMVEDFLGRAYSFDAFANDLRGN